ncbi:hypothetical protein RND81_05G106800 [Saponaria officinalis]|uniref:Uncharacterized protein n=1 Tax=Saponaria officinalis TaxID=3572 RepID=A0AAW1KUE6_SAPOF
MIRILSITFLSHFFSSFLSHDTYDNFKSKMLYEYIANMTGFSRIPHQK